MKQRSLLINSHDQWKLNFNNVCGYHGCMIRLLCQIVYSIGYGAYMQRDLIVPIRLVTRLNQSVHKSMTIVKNLAGIQCSKV